MNKKIFKSILLASCGLGIAAAIPATAINYSKTTNDQNKQVVLNSNFANKKSVTDYKPYDVKDVVMKMADQFETVAAQLVEVISANRNVPQVYKGYAQQLFNLLEQNIKPVLQTITSKTPDVEEWQDPLEIFQEVLVLFHDDIMNAINKVCENQFVQFLFGEEKINHFINLWEGILTKQIDLEKYAKNNWSLQDIFEGILYPLFGEGEQAKEKAWELIFSVYSDTYYTGLDFNHKNGERIQGTYELLDTPTYTNKYAWDNVKRGDVVFSAQGFALGGHYSGHCAIVDGWYNAKVQGTDEVVQYLRVVEANQFGVSYGLLDDVRMVKDQMTVLRISDASDEQIEAATQFCESQLGKNYNIPIFLSEDVDADAGAWYCSELVWAGYMNQGIDIQSNDYYAADIPGILPWEILYYNNAKAIIGWNFLK